MKEEMAGWREMGGTVFNGMVDALTGLASGAKNFGDVMRGVLNDIARQLMSSGLMTLFGGGKGIGNLLSSLFGGGSSLNMFAKGGIVNSPTMLNSNTIAGEAGAEAVMPLQRHNGKLGVGVSPVNVTVQNYGNQNVDVQTDDKGKIDIIIGQIANQIKRGTGVLPNAFEGRYNLQKG